MNELGPVVVCVTVTENPTRHESERGTPIATFWVSVCRQWAGPVNLWSKSVHCRAVGYPANSVLKYARTGIVALVAGYLMQDVVPTEDGGSQEELQIRVEQIGYLSPRSVREAQGRTW